MIELVADNDDLQVARSAAAGDSEAFESLYRRHVGTVFGMLRRVLSEADAEDATQETFVRAWRGIPGFRGDATFGSWVFRIARSVLLTRLASRPQPMPLIEEPAIEEPAIERSPERTTDDLEAAIATLPEGARAVVTLHHLCGYAHEEISRALGISVGTSKSQLHRARALLRGRLQARSGSVREDES